MLKALQIYTIIRKLQTNLYIIRVFLLLSYPIPMGHALMKLEKGRQQKTEGEADGHEQMTLAAAEKLLYRKVVHIGIGTREDEHHRIVCHMHHDSWQDAPRTPVKPSQEKSQKEGVRHLRGIHVRCGKEQGRHADGYPGSIGVRGEG